MDFHHSGFQSGFCSDLRKKMSVHKCMISKLGLLIFLHCSHRRTHAIIQTLIEVKEGEKLMLTLQNVVLLKCISSNCKVSFTSSAFTRKEAENIMISFSTDLYLIKFSELAAGL